jgi:hypothetical protein
MFRLNCQYKTKQIVSVELEIVVSQEENKKRTFHYYREEKNVDNFRAAAPLG